MGFFRSILILTRQGKERREPFFSLAIRVYFEVEYYLKLTKAASMNFKIAPASGVRRRVSF